MSVCEGGQEHATVKRACQSGVDVQRISRRYQQHKRSQQAAFGRLLTDPDPLSDYGWARRGVRSLDSANRDSYIGPSQEGQGHKQLLISPPPLSYYIMASMTTSMISAVTDYRPSNPDSSHPQLHQPLGKPDDKAQTSHSESTTQHSTQPPPTQTSLRSVSQSGAASPPPVIVFSLDGEILAPK
jgi:hypothetical protein